jgi:transcriptional regulator with XRE-family HTH domain
MAESSKTGSQEFGDLLRRARERRGMTRRDLAAATELSYPYISQLETGYRQPSPAAIQNLASALRISLDEMFDAMGRRPAEAEPDAMIGTGSDWTPNSNYSGSGLRAAPPAPEFPPISYASLAPAAAPLDGGETDNGAVTSAEGIVADVLNVLSAVPPQERLDAVAEVQARVIQAVIDDRLARSRPPS